MSRNPLRLSSPAGAGDPVSADKDWTPRFREA